MTLTAGLFGLVIHSLIGEDGGAEKFPISWFIIAAAVLGSAVNQPFRNDLPAGSSGESHPVIYFLWKCSVAVVFAFLLYLMFMAGILGGDLFPRFQCLEPSAAGNSCGKYIDMARFVTDVDPETNRDVAKLLIWSFIAGFSEKLVPNLITKLGEQASESGKHGDSG
jgi:hypothetical protein